MEGQERFENIPKWENMDKDMLANIFKKLDVVDVVMGASRVCITWFLASHNKTIWNTIKLNDLDSIVLDKPSKPNKNKGDKHRYHLREILIEINKFSRGAPVEIFFNVKSNVQEEDLAIISNGLPNIKKLALPIKKTQSLNSFASSFSKWKNLQTLIIAKFAEGDDLNHEFEAIADNCRNLTNVKFTYYTLDQELANIILGKLPNLKTLSFRCSSVFRETVKSLIIGLHNLKSLNLSHCIFTKRCNNGMTLGTIGMSPEDELLKLGTQKLETVKVCYWRCIVCTDMWSHSLLPEYYTSDHRDNKYWKTDEINEFNFY